MWSAHTAFLAASRPFVPHAQWPSQIPVPLLFVSCAFFSPCTVTPRGRLGALYKGPCWGSSKSSCWNSFVMTGMHSAMGTSRGEWSIHSQGTKDRHGVGLHDPIHKQSYGSHSRIIWLPAYLWAFSWMTQVLGRWHGREQALESQSCLCSQNYHLFF